MESNQSWPQHRQIKHPSAENPRDFNWDSFPQKKSLRSGGVVGGIFKSAQDLARRVAFGTGLITGVGITCFIASGREAESQATIDGLEEVIRIEVKGTNEHLETIRRQEETISALQKLLEQDRREANFPLSQDPQPIPKDL